jgi:AcrR family transcriptional regulator
MKKTTRPYVQTTRRKMQEQTRLRIVEALVALHEEIGPKNTTIAAVAERAGVQRLTVYRHFENEAAMLEACSGHWTMQNPPPHESEWQDIQDPLEKTSAALLAINTYYAKSEGMLSKVYRDRSEVAALDSIMQGFDDYFSGMVKNLVSDLTGSRSNKVLKPVLLHLTRFTTWQSLSKEKLSVKLITELEMRWIKELVGS